MRQLMSFAFNIEDKCEVVEFDNTIDYKWLQKGSKQACKPFDWRLIYHCRHFVFLDIFIAARNSWKLDDPEGL